MIVDLHCHPSREAFLSEGKNIWDCDPPKKHQRGLMINTSMLSNWNQCDFTSMAKADMRVVFFSIYPIEQGFFTNIMNKEILDPDKDKTLINLIGFLRKLLLNKEELVISKLLVKVDAKIHKAIASENHGYFDSLIGEYELLKKQKDSPNLIDGKKYKIRIVKDWADLNNFLNVDQDFNVPPPNENLILVVLTVEGAQSLGCGQLNTGKADPDDLTNNATKKLLASLTSNIQKLKSLGFNNNGSHCPFFITFSHHFNNQLCGHSMSFAKVMHGIFDQNNRLGEGFTELGKTVRDLLLSTDNGRRILIDIKHLSPKGRMEFYKFVDDKRKQNDPIPIVASHMGFNGLPTIADESQWNTKNHNEMDKRYENSEHFNNWDINLFDDEIVKINDSGGLIGINFDQRIVTGNKLLKVIKVKSKGGSATAAALQRWTEPIAMHIEHAINVVMNSNSPNKEYVWQLLGIGTDFEGMIDPLDSYTHVGDLTNLKKVLVAKLKIRARTNPHLQQRNIEEVVDGFMYKNALRFLSRHHH